MKFNTLENEKLMGQAAAKLGAEAIRQAISNKGKATIIIATGSSQFDMLQHLTEQEDIPWEKVQAFHLDEYVGLSAEHPASFRKYLNERFVAKAKGLNKMTLVNADAEDLEAEIARLNALIAQEEVDVCLAGIGENGHLAFNDPPADLATYEPYIVVELDQACRQQQCNEGWFNGLADVPSKAISMSINQILKSKKIILSVPGERKAEAVKNTVAKSISADYPSSVLQGHADCEIFLDVESASLLPEKVS
ncbi:glucosamine-6-phosphate deaminase [Thalassotalea fonticola]|uniref:Glucosamine-6-phosphate deaminase n=1 Tax=Thalassotalea fonticola TaxID=3065649 RepID=A0ABZ0GJP3_9GAMM|nr:glucosamine-6-phosphate deaminase [Colwelliaceae bacterium S1-1]